MSENSGVGLAAQSVSEEVAETEGVAADDAATWRARAAVWELLALSFRYPDGVLADAVASGEWADAARELAGALSLELPEGFAEGVGKLPHAVESAAEVAASALDTGAGSIEAEGADDAAVGGVPDSDSLLHALRAEATRLFVGAPEPACSPYEGVWRAADDGVQPLLFVNPHSMEVERFCRSCGLGRPEGTNEPLDHAAAECELLEHLSLRAAAEAEGAGDHGAAPASEPAPAEPASGDAPTEPAPALPAPADLPGGSPQAAYALFLDEHTRVWMPRFAASVAAESRHPLYRSAAELLATMVG